MYRVGLLSPGAALFFIDPFLSEMSERGWVEGRHFNLERRSTGADMNSAPALARELVDLPVDVIVTVITGSAIAARRATRQIPIVMVSSGYPVEAGLADSLAKPGTAVPSSPPSSASSSCESRRGRSPRSVGGWTPGAAWVTW